LDFSFSAFPRFSFSEWLGGLRRFESPASPFRLRYGGGDDVSFFVISACQHLVFSLSAE
jgi:hypothetical protein